MLPLRLLAPVVVASTVGVFVAVAPDALPPAVA